MEQLMEIGERAKLAARAVGLAGADERIALWQQLQRL